VQESISDELTQHHQHRFRELYRPGLQGHGNRSPGQYFILRHDHLYDIRFSGRDITTKTATFSTVDAQSGNGTQGYIRYLVETGFLTAGDWKVRGRVATGSSPVTAQLSTVWHYFTVAG
jgi:hypothetical protein